MPDQHEAFTALPSYEEAAQNARVRFRDRPEGVRVALDDEGLRVLRQEELARRSALPEGLSEQEAKKKRAIAAVSAVGQAVVSVVTQIPGAHGVAGAVLGVAVTAGEAAATYAVEQPYREERAKIEQSLVDTGALLERNHTSAKQAIGDAASQLHDMERRFEAYEFSTWKEENPNAGTDEYLAKPSAAPTPSSAQEDITGARQRGREKAQVDNSAPTRMERAKALVKQAADFVISLVPFSSLALLPQTLRQIPGRVQAKHAPLKEGKLLEETVREQEFFAQRDLNPEIQTMRERMERLDLRVPGRGQDAAVRSYGADVSATVRDTRPSVRGGSSGRQVMRGVELETEQKELADARNSDLRSMASAAEALKERLQSLAKGGGLRGVRFIDESRSAAPLPKLPSEQERNRRLVQHREGEALVSMSKRSPLRTRSPLPPGEHPQRTPGRHV